MIEVLNIALNNNYIYGGIIGVLIIIIIITIISIKKDRDRLVKSRVKEVEPVFEPAKTEEEQAKARFELSKAIKDMKEEIETKPVIDDDDIKNYEQDQEENAIISYQELVEAVRKQNIDHQPQTEVGMEVADNKAIEEPNLDNNLNEVEAFKEATPKTIDEEITKKADDLVDMINTADDTPIYEERTIENHPDEPDHTTITETVIYKEEPEEVDRTLTSDERKFQTSEFISPVFGKNPQADINVVDRKKTLDDIINNEDTEDNDEFLDNLKNFKERL